MDEIIAELRSRFAEARSKAESSEAIAPNSYGAGFDRGYSDALGEFLEHLTEPQTPEPMTEQKFDDLNKRST